MLPDRSGGNNPARLVIPLLALLELWTESCHFPRRLATQAAWKACGLLAGIGTQHQQRFCALVRSKW